MKHDTFKKEYSDKIMGRPIRVNRQKLNLTINKDYTELIFFGDIHFGHDCCDGKKANEMRNYCLDKKIAVLGMGDYCLPIEAEILTKEGWKNYKEVKIWDIVMGFDGKKIIDTKITKIHIATLPMKNIYSKSFNLICSDNHNHMILQKISSREFIKKVPTKNLKSGQRLIIASTYFKGGLLNLTEEEIKIIGWLVTDGSIRNKRGLNAVICQSKEPYKSQIRNTLSKWFTGEYKDKTGSSQFHLKAEKLRGLFKKIKLNNPLNLKKELIKLIFKISFKNRIILMRTMLNAEGWKERDLWRFSQKDGDILEAFKILATLNGFRLGIGKYNRNKVRTIPLMESRKYVDVTDLKIKEVGLMKAWCPTTEIGTWITKYKNQITITGNCEAGIRSSIGDSLFKQRVNPQGQLESVIEFFKPLAKERLLLGLHSGNHEDRILKETGLNPTKIMCNQLSVNYLDSAIWNLFNVGEENYTIYSLHGSSGSRYVYTKLKSIVDISHNFDADVIAMGHTHDLGDVSTLVQYYDRINKVIKERKKFLVLTGHYLKYDDSYAQMKGLPLGKEGSPKIKLYGNKKDVHISE